MTKTNCLNKTLAILLSVLLALPLYVLSTAAANDGYTELETDTSECETGDYWYDRDALADDTGTAAYARASYYLSDDGNTLKIEYKANDETVTELYDKNAQPVYFDYIRVLPAFGDPLPTSEDGLEDGDYWYDMDGLVALLQAVGESETTISTVMNATFRLSVDGTILRMTAAIPGSGMYLNQDEFISQPDVLCGYLRQVGVDPVTQYEGFTQLPTSADGLEAGDCWFDAAALAEEEGEAVFLQALYYISDDGDTLRIVIAGTIIDVTREEEPEVFAFLCEIYEDFTLLPKSDEGLADGDWWFDAAGLAVAAGAEELQTLAKYYLSDDGDTIRLVSPSVGQLDVARDSDMGKTVFLYLHQVGADPNAIEGFTLLSFSDEGLADGDWWYDAAALAEMFDEANYLTYRYYLSDDGATLRIIMGGGTLDVTEDEDDDMKFYFHFLRQVGVDPYPGFILLPKSDEGLADGDYWYDAAGFAAMSGDDSAQRAEYLLSEDGSTLRIMQNGYTFEIHKGRDGFGPYFAYLRTAGEVYTVLPTSDEGLADGDWWYDAAALAEAMQDDSFLTATYSLSENGETLCIVNGDTTTYYQNDAGFAQYFLYLYQVGVDPFEGFTLLPTSADGLAFGAYWYDAAGLAALWDNEDAPTYAYYLHAETGALRIVVDGYPYDLSPDDEEFEEAIQFLKQATVDPDTGIAFTLLPTSDEGLADGDYWYDAAGLAQVVEDDDYLTYQYYLSEDGDTLRIVLADTFVDLTRAQEPEAFAFLRQVGVDPFEGFTLLPTSADGLAEGDLWFDAAGLAEAEDDQGILTYQFYLSDDGNTIRVDVSGMTLDFAADSAEGADLFSYLHQVTADSGEVCLTLTAPTAPVRPGDTVTVTVDLAQNSGVAGMTLSLQYDEDVLTLTDVQASGMFNAGNLTLGGDLTAAPFTVLWDDAEAHENHTETGTVLTLTFTVKDTAAAGETTVTLDYDADATFDVDLQSVPVVISAATVTVITRLPGDADGDRELDLADVAALTRYLAGGWDVTVKEENCDVNGDGEIDLKDVILIRRYLAGGWGVELV